MKHLKYKRIVFDDWGKDIDNHYWAEMCQNCAEKYKDIISNELDDGNIALGICSVLGCSNPSKYYFDCDDGLEVKLEDG